MVIGHWSLVVGHWSIINNRRSLACYIFYLVAIALRETCAKVILKTQRKFNYCGLITTVSFPIARYNYQFCLLTFNF
ncbi:hypothetical protein C7B79_23485 [Chroococcidiopsis cubana CCALA 043]|nr:hypothetical protein C7B80_09100 [Cyanosarcina cf. burmensis CCALA 770]PSB61036.1 hypothetical protein C7B79_23485 [Chroococcidiopsis cubana CCALA 043]